MTLSVDTLGIGRLTKFSHLESLMTLSVTSDANKQKIYLKFSSIIGSFNCVTIMIIQIIVIIRSCNSKTISHFICLNSIYALIENVEISFHWILVYNSRFFQQKIGDFSTTWLARCKKNFYIFSLWKESLLF